MGEHFFFFLKLQSNITRNCLEIVFISIVYNVRSRYINVGGRYHRFSYIGTKREILLIGNKTIFFFFFEIQILYIVSINTLNCRSNLFKNTFKL